MRQETANGRGAWLLAVVGALGLMIAVAAPAGAVQSMSVSEFQSRIDAAAAQARAGVAAPSPVNMDEVRSDLGLPSSLTLSDGAIVELPADAYLAGLTGERAEDFAAAVRHLDALGDEVTTLAATPAPDEAAILAALRAAFGGPPPPPPPSPAKPAVVGGSAGHRGSFGLGGFAKTMALLVIAVVLALAATTVLRRLMPDVIRRSDEEERSLTPTELRDRGDEAVQSGDLMDAARYFYRSLLADLAAEGIVPHTTSLTAGECRAAVAGSRPVLKAPVASATSAFESILFGGREPTTDAVESLKRAVAAVGA